MMKRSRLIVSLLGVFCAILLLVSAAGSRSQSRVEAPTGFDDQTNGMVDQAVHDEDRTEFFEEIPEFNQHPEDRVIVVPQFSVRAPLNVCFALAVRMTTTQFAASASAKDRETYTRSRRHAALRLEIPSSAVRGIELSLS